MTRPVRTGELSVRSRSAEDTERLGLEIGTALEGGEVLALYGDLGTGKTTLVRGIAAGLGATRSAVTSPTFVLIHEYRGRLRLAHADLYRLSRSEELEHVGLWEYLDDGTVIAIEWAEKAGGDLPDDRLDVHLTHEGADERRLSLAATGARARRLLDRISGRLVPA